jgi:hypothetical protein
MKYLPYAVAVLAMFSVLSCGLFKGAGRNAGEGVMEAITAGGAQASRSVMGGVGSGLRDSVLNAETRAALDSLVIAATVRLNEQTNALRDSLLGREMRELIAGIVYAAVGDTTRLYLAGLREELLGEQTRRLIAELRNEMLSDSTVAGIGRIRDELLGPKTQSAVQAIVDSAMTGIIRRYVEDLKPELREELGFIQKNATYLLVLGGVVVIVIVRVVWHQKQKYRKTLNVLTYQIHEIPDQKAYDELTGRIRKKAQETGVERDLRKILVEQGILGEESWETPHA